MTAAVQLYPDTGGAFHLDSWADRAACKGLDKVAILEDPDRETEAKTLCLGDSLRGIPRCPVINECHAWVIPLRCKEDPGGVRAGRNENERNAFRRSVGHHAKNNKYCRRCEQTKDRSEFFRHRRNKDGLASCCKTCHSAAKAALRARKAAA